MKIQQLDTILPGFAALDLGATQIHAATAGTPVAVFGTTTAEEAEGKRGGWWTGEPELRRLGAWLSTHGVRHVAMEATGVYWIPVHDQLQQAGFVPTLFHGAHARNLPGKKSDFSDCQWHAVLHSHGLLRPCFIAPEAVRALRAYARLREDHLEQAAMCVAHMQRALDCMNGRLHTVISQLHGVSGLRVIEAIKSGRARTESAHRALRRADLETQPRRSRSEPGGPLAGASCLRAAPGYSPTHQPP
jgi:hypothetical protein